jgi:hypothetical protein
LTRWRGIRRKVRQNCLRKGDFHAISTNVALKNNRAIQSTYDSLKEKIPQTVIAGNSGIGVSAIKLVASI